MQQRLIDQVEQDLRELADPDRAIKMQAYMKSSMPYLGVPMPQVRKLTSAAVRAFPFASAEQLLATAEVLWREAEYRELRYVALALTALKPARGNLNFLPLYEEMVSTGAWWDYVDEVSHRIQELLKSQPATMKPLIRRWSVASDFWFRRLSIISQLQLKTATDLDLLSSVIDANAADKEFFIRKAIGWALREYSKTDPQWVSAFVAARTSTLSPLSQREALKRLR
ncbi:DNA alkylation repair protein [Psychromicrobium lacuslunae]|uniref:DNA alkylation repair protein n=1 Tax=Psychromicrobium lacuslunae TaxID=1618207 RepID=A0A0D4BXJ2_9MICC|nr:DNA alkylation repair protein [Psychromicrobium lacuslunae]AJT41172.1 DNA alkylation repair protein [Psychromicrobium lacuslunae]